MRAALKKHIEETKVPRRRVSAKLSISESALSQYLNDKYPGDVEKINASVKDYLQWFKDSQNSKSRQPKNPFVMTRQAKRAYAVLRTCHLEGDMGVIIAQPGMGKTQSVNQYAKDNRDCILITTLITVNMKSLLKQISDSLKVVTDNTNDARARAIMHILKGSGKMIIVDEAQFLSTSCLEILRQIHDEAGIGLVYAGTPILHANMRGSGSKSLAQIYSRVGSIGELPPLNQADVELILNSTGIRLNAESLKRAAMECDGSARQLMKSFKNACRRTAPDGSGGISITPQAITAAQRQMMAG